ncbi:MAG: tRNA pseudouridine(55) synthase TruB [Thermoleophilia bacterium]|nr:tRNA pseudouridine(55) synthase TruB [Thermoleophilia bacterium]
MASFDCAIALVDKPAGVTSHDVVFRARGRLSALASAAAGKRVRVKTGHAGTLDPFATGLLVILAGRATRLQRYLLHQPKTYRVVARLGWRSDSGDPDGELTHTGRVPADPQLPTGALRLPVPAFSAIKVGGERLYAKARRGESFEPPLREMTVYRAQRMRFDGERATFEIDCAGGTYVRSVVATLEDAYCEALERTRVGDLRLEDAVPSDALSLDDLIDPLDVLAHLPARDLTDDQAESLIHGRALPAEGAADGDPQRLVTGGRLLGVGRVVDGSLEPETILAASLEDLRAR